MDSARGLRPYDGFDGEVHRTFGASTPSWPTRATPPEGAPNVIVMLVDDMGFSDLGCYGSEISTPALDDIAGEGLRFSNFHTTSLCSPTRAALLTGRNQHAVGVGMVSNNDPGFPGYAGELPENQPSMAEIFRHNGYATMMLGKWHLSKDSEMHEAASKHSWPLQRGFDQYYGFLEAMTNFHHPHRLFEGNSVVDTDSYPDDYYLTTDLTDRAESMIRASKAADPSKPFFMYFSHGACHAPLQAPKEDIARQRGRYDKGWDEIREERLARQIELGVIPPGTELPQRNTEEHLDVEEWAGQPEEHRQVLARYMEVYAAMVESIDASVARLRTVLEELGEWDDTVFLFLSDNGASREGLTHGSNFYQRLSSPTTSTSEVTEQDLRMFAEDEIGGPRSWAHYPRGWAMACNTPFRLYKITTYRGGHTVPMIFRAPALGDTAGSVIRQQYVHVTDILPTLTDMIGLRVPDSRAGLPANPVDGSSFAAMLTDTGAPSAHTEQYYECNGNRGYYRDGWEAVTMREALQPSASLPDRKGLVPLSQEDWELFHVDRDLNQLHDLADSHPEILEELKAAWDAAAWANQVFPINEGAGANHLRRPPGDAVYEQPLRLGPGTPTLERYRSLRLIAGRPFRITVDATVDAGSQGVLVSHGGQESGYMVHLEDGRVHFTHNFFGDMTVLSGPAPTGRVELVVDVALPDRLTWDVTVTANGVEIASGTMTALRGMTPFQGIDVGADRRSPVSWDTYSRHRSFPFDGELHSVAYEPGVRTREALDALIEEAVAVGAALE
ncbi:arylsulfatase [Dietzia aurantiaca]|uniref:Arylsulfatase n=1 Tax=Dietzia aurantiaca TaxID=983873 RepID=A0ABV9PRS6_9ACTN